MAKNISFAANMPLTPADMNALLQDGQIMQQTGAGASDLMSQKAITDALTALDAKKENVIDRASAFNKPFGAEAGTVCEGDDARLSDSRRCNNTFDDAAEAKRNLSLDKVDNTPDLDKPVSSAVQSALDNKANTSGTYSGLTAGDANNLGGVAPTGYVNTTTAQTIGGDKTFTGNVRLGTSWNGKLIFGDNDYVHLYEYGDDYLEIKASMFKLVGANWDANSSKIPAAMISISNGSAFGKSSGVATLQDALNYIAKVFAGTQTVTKLCANTFDAK